MTITPDPEPRPEQLDRLEDTTRLIAVSAYMDVLDGLTPSGLTFVEDYLFDHRTRRAFDRASSMREHRRVAAVVAGVRKRKGWVR